MSFFYIALAPFCRQVVTDSSHSGRTRVVLLPVSWKGEEVLQAHVRLSSVAKGHMILSHCVSGMHTGLCSINNLSKALGCSCHLLCRCFFYFLFLLGPIRVLCFLSSWTFLKSSTLLCACVSFFGPTSSFSYSSVFFTVKWSFCKHVCPYVKIVYIL